MLLLTFRSGANLYGVDARQVVEVVPRVELRPIPHAPPHLAGLLNYRDRVVPVVDFNVLVGNSGASRALSSRVIVTQFERPDGTTRRLGLAAERVNQLLRAEAVDDVLPGMDLEQARYLGGVYRLEEGLVQVVKPAKILPESVLASLFEAPAGTT